MHYLVYKTTCLVTGKVYVGKHQTKNINDGYLGSGKLLLRAITKYGLENFVTEIIGHYEVEWKMTLAEKVLVVCDSDLSYNLCPGGKGGFGYINTNKLNLDLNSLPKAKMRRARSKGGKAANLRRFTDEEHRCKVLAARRAASLGGNNPQYGKPSWNKGKNLSNAHKEKIRLAALRVEAAKRASRQKFIPE